MKSFIHERKVLDKETLNKKGNKSRSKEGLSIEGPVDLESREKGGRGGASPSL